MKYQPLDLDDTFEDLMRQANPEVLSHSVQYRESRRLFYAGAAAVFYHTLELATLGDEAEYETAEEGLANLQKQIEDFFKNRVAHDKD